MLDNAIDVQLKTKATKTETLMREKDRDAGESHRLSESQTTNLSVKRRVEEDVEAVADLIYRVINEGDELARQMVPEEVWDEYSVDLRDEATLNVHVTGVEGVYLAARKHAYEKTKESMTRTGTSVEQVLCRWAYNDNIAPYSKVEVSFGNFDQSARYVLDALMIDHTPGGEINADDLPDHDEWGDRDLDRKEMLPEKTA